MTWIDALQWPAMAVTVMAAWVIGDESAWRRRLGFWGLIIGNVLWVGWGLHDGAWALIGLQAFLCAINLRNERKNLHQAEREEPQR